MLNNQIVKKQTVGRKLARLLIKINNEIMGLVIILTVIALVLSIFIPDFAS